MRLPSIEEVWIGDDVGSRLLRALLVPLSWIFGAVVAVRNRLYDADVFSVARVGVPVVCVGNLRVGGSGKTPLVIWLAKRLRERGRRPVVVSRGYGAAADKIALISSPLPGSLPAGVVAIDAGAAAGGDAADEAVLVARRAEVPVVTGADRAAACRTALAVFDADIIVLDDGFQHRSLHRDLDLVLVDDRDRRAHLLPAGPMREKTASLGRAHFVVDTGRAAPPGSITMVGCPLALVRHVASVVEEESLERLSGARVLAVAGIARPDRFIGSLEKLGARIEDTMLFADHYTYTAGDWAQMRHRAAGVDLVVTTEKDLVKLEAFQGAEDDELASRLMALRYEVEIGGGETILERIGQFDASAGGPHHRELRESRNGG